VVRRLFRQSKRCGLCVVWHQSNKLLCRGLQSFPAKVVAEKHRGREWTVLLGRRCYEAADDLEILVAGAPVAVAKKGINVERGLTCLHFAQPFLPGHGLFRLLQSSCWMSGFCVESLPMACWCPACTENLTIELAEKN
jgi:hypothetical protein